MARDRKYSIQEAKLLQVDELVTRALKSRKLAKETYDELLQRLITQYKARDKIQ